ncbi:MAG: manganese efflux pump MntP family protein [Oscillospiraceae bacterium]
MDFITLLLLSLGLAMDAFAVSVTNGLSYKNSEKNHAVLCAFSFGVAQAMMPVIGYFCGSLFIDFISKIDHWVILIILGFIGINMIIEAIKNMKMRDDEEKNLPKFTYKLMIVQAVATSIDALSVGVGFAAIDVNIINAGLMIGIVTFICCYIGVKIGEKFGGKFKEKAEIFGGSILVLIGLKIFLEHTQIL